MRVLTAAVLCLWTSLVGAADDSVVDLAKIERRIAREPVYQNQPHYALFVFGPRAEQRAWFVTDGDRLAYLDRNGNGDLTDPEDRVELDVEATNKIKVGGSSPYKSMHVFSLGKVFGTKLTFQLWVRNLEYDVSKEEFLRDWHRELDEHRWINGSLIREAQDKTTSQNPLLLTVKPGDAQISHFGGPLTFALAYGDESQFEPWPKKSELAINIGCRNLLAKNCTRQAFGLTRLTTTEVPADIHPVADVEYPASGDTGKPTTQTLQIKLDQRCCGDRFYSLFKLPKDVAGEAVTVKVSIPDDTGMKTVPAEFTVPVSKNLSRDKEQMFVIFKDPNIELKHAVNVFRKKGLNVKLESQGLRVAFDDGTMLAIRLERSDEVQKTATAIGLNTEHAAPLSHCNARFEIAFSDLDKLLTQPDGLREVQQALLQLTKGYSYTTWDKQLSK